VIGLRTTAQEVKARWVYGELTSRRFGRRYPGGPQHIYDLAMAKNPFPALTASDQAELVKMFDRARPERAAEVDRSELYRCEAWTKGHLAQCWALPEFNPPTRRHPIPYYDFYLAAPNANARGGIEEEDPRAEAMRIPSGTPFNQFHEPAVVVGSLGDYHLIEGYLRSILFMRAGDLSQRLLVWVPYTPRPKPLKTSLSA
jgi:hypothetical protein